MLAKQGYHAATPYIISRKRYIMFVRLQIPIETDTKTPTYICKSVFFSFDFLFFNAFFHLSNIAYHTGRILQKVDR